MLPAEAPWDYARLFAVERGRLLADQPGPCLAANLAMTAEQAWRLLTNNLPAAGQTDLTVSGDNVTTTILLRTRAIIGTPKWGSATLAGHLSDGACSGGAPARCQRRQRDR